MTIRTAIIRPIVLTATVAGVISTAPVMAASSCKGLDNTACSKQSSCTWVEGYERKDGRKVKSFCRTKPAATKETSTTSPRIGKKIG